MEVDYESSDGGFRLLSNDEMDKDEFHDNANRDYEFDKDDNDLFEFDDEHLE